MAGIHAAPRPRNVVSGWRRQLPLRSASVFAAAIAIATQNSAVPDTLLLQTFKILDEQPQLQPKSAMRDGHSDQAEERCCAEQRENGPAYLAAEKCPSTSVSE